MFYKVFYNGFALHDYCVINRINKRTASRANNYISNKYSGRARLKNSRLDPLEIELEVTIKDNVQYNLDQLNLILEVNEPKDLIVAQTPERKLTCIPVGGIEPSSFLRNSEFKIAFESENSYWGSTNGVTRGAFYKSHYELENKGTHPTFPRFEFVFQSDCGYVGLIAPNGYITLGNKDEADAVIVPPSEFAIDDRLTSLTGWTSVDLNKYKFYDGVFNSIGASPKLDGGWGINKQSSWTEAKWYGHAYEKTFAAGTLGVAGAENFDLDIKGVMTNMNANTDASGVIMVMVLDTNGVPMMSTILYDHAHNSNELTIIHFLYNNEGNAISSKKDKISTFDGNISLEKNGNKFMWDTTSSGGYVFTKGAQGETQPKVGDTTYIKSSARYGYDHVGNRFTIKDFTRGRAYKITDSKMQGSVRRYLISYQGTPVYWMNIEDLMGSKTESTIKRGRSGYEYSNFVEYNNSVAQRTAGKVVLYIGTWGALQPYTNHKIKDIRVKRLYTSRYHDLPNLFKKYDILEIDNATGTILHNYKPIRAIPDVDSTFFSCDGGKSDIRLVVSSWAQEPVVIVEHEDRWK